MAGDRLGPAPAPRAWCSALKQRDPESLSPLEVNHVPLELEPVVASLDRLLLQLTALLERERRFLAYAAHELRTPLAVLRIHAQNALQAPDPADRDAALRQLEGGIERATPGGGAAADPGPS